MSSYADHNERMVATLKARIGKLEAALRELIGAVADPTSQKSLPLALTEARTALKDRT